MFVSVRISLNREVMFELKFKGQLAVGSILGLSSGTTMFKVANEFV